MEKYMHTRRKMDKKEVVYIQNLTGNAGSTDDPTVTATIVTKLQAK